METTLPPPPVTAPPAAPRTSQLAIWSLVLAILGYCCLSCFGFIPGIILGHMALSRIKSSGGTLTGEGMAIGGLVFGYIGAALTVLILVLVAAGVALPGLSQARQKAGQVRDISNLKQIGLAGNIYEMEHTNAPAPDLKSLVPYLGSGSNAGALFTTSTEKREQGSLDEADAWSDYQWVPEPAGESPQTEVRAFMKEPTETGGAVLYRDGHVEWLSVDQYNEAVAPYRPEELPSN